MNPSRRAALLACASAVASPLRAAEYPTRPVVLWVPWPAGGATDTTFFTVFGLSVYLIQIYMQIQ